MAWTPPTTWVAGVTVGATDLNSNIRDNMNFVFNGKAAQVVRFLSNYATTGTSFADIDATNLIITKTITTGRALVAFIGCGADMNAVPGATTDWGAFDIIVDSTTRAGDATYGTLIWNSAGGSGYGGPQPVVIALFTGLSAASHTFKPQWKTNNAANAIRLRPSGVFVNTNGTQVFAVLEV